MSNNKVKTNLNFTIREFDIQLHSEYKGGHAKHANVCSTYLLKTLPKEPEKQSTMKLFMQ